MSPLSLTAVFASPISWRSKALGRPGKIGVRALSLTQAAFRR